MTKNINIIRGLLLVLISIVANPLQAQAINYYVDRNHASASDNNIGTIDRPWKTITKANQTLKAGDTVYIKGGTYSNYINPSRSGTASNRITYRNYGTDVVTISGAAYAVYLNGKDYITIDGINGFNNNQLLFLINGANYNIIKNSSFDRNTPSEWTSSLINDDSQYNWIHDNQFSKGGQCSGGSDDGSVLEIGTEDSGTDNTNYNLIEDNTFFHGGHHVVGLYGRYNTFRNNYMHNEVWTNGKGNRTLYMLGYASNGIYNLIENNRFGYTAAPCDAPSTGGVLLASSYNILRYNSFYHNIIHGLLLQVYDGQDVNENKLYNNTFFNNCDSDEEPSICDGGFEDSAVGFNDWVSGKEVVDNVFKNNLYYSHYTLYTDTDQANVGDQTFANEFNGDTQGDPLFFNAKTTPPANKMDSTVPNLDLQSGSPAIDAGGALTKVSVADAGSGTSLVVSDSGYFQDGTWAPPGTIEADWIAVGTVGNVVQISSISGNTITLSNSISRQGGDSVWLYKDSDGTIVLYGSAPDAGAYEFLQDQALLPPKNLRIIDSTSAILDQYLNLAPFGRTFSL